MKTKVVSSICAVAVFLGGLVFVPGLKASAATYSSYSVTSSYNSGASTNLDKEQSQNVAITVSFGSNISVSDDDDVANDLKVYLNDSTTALPTSDPGSGGAAYVYVTHTASSFTINIQASSGAQVPPTTPFFAMMSGHIVVDDANGLGTIPSVTIGGSAITWNDIDTINKSGTAATQSNTTATVSTPASSSLTFTNVAQVRGIVWFALKYRSSSSGTWGYVAPTSTATANPTIGGNTIPIAGIHAHFFYNLTTSQYAAWIVNGDSMSGGAFAYSGYSVSYSGSTVTVTKTGTPVAGEQVSFEIFQNGNASPYFQ